ncbi:MAG: 30S ribosome-binding factor RbfA [Parcubacteria group bacterium]|jgi:ribosome-binding factor A
MASSRLNRVNELIKITLAEIISREVELPPGVFATVMKVDTTRDLRYAQVFVSVFPENKFGKTMEFLQKRIYSVQGELNKKLHMKPLPRIEFVCDHTEAEADKIEKMLKEL